MARKDSPYPCDMLRRGIPANEIRCHMCDEVWDGQDAYSALPACVDCRDIADQLGRLWVEAALATDTDQLEQQTETPG